MAKNKITDYSATNASNTDVGGIDIQGTGYISNGDNAFREIMTHLAETNAGTYPVADTWSFADPGDLTKRVRLDTAVISPGATRVLTVPDASITIVGKDHPQTLTNKSLSDSTTYFVDNSDATKRLQFQISGITTATTRTLTAPDRNGTLMTGPSSTTDNGIPRFDGTSGDIQTSNSSVIITDAGGIQVAGGSAAAPSLTFASAGNDGFYARTSSSLGVAIDGTEVGYFGTAGFTFADNNYITYGGTGAASQRTALGLGTAATQNTGTSGANVPLMNGANTWSNTQNLTNSSNPITIVERVGAASNALIQYKTTAASMYAGNSTSGAIFAIGSAADLTVASNRVFAASTDYTYFGSQAVDIPGISNTSTGMTLDVVSGYKLRISTTSGTNLQLNVNTNPSDAIDFRYQGTPKGSVTVTSTNTAYNTTSDENLKNFTGTYSYEAAKAIIQADPVRSFTWKDGGEAAIGWGAQTSYAVSPDLATPGRGKPGDDDYRPWGVDQGKRTPYLWAAVSGLIDEIEGLKAEIAALKAA